MTQRDTTSLVMRCGPNALYLLLKGHGRSVPFEAVERELDVTEKGVSILNLRDAAGRLGFPAAVRRMSMEDLRHIPLPVVGYFPDSYSNDSTGHFVLIYKVETAGGRPGVWFIDATDGQKVKYKWDRFPLYWSGHVLQPQPRVWDSPALPWVLSATGWLAAYGFVRSRFWKRRPVKTLVAAAATFAAVLPLRATAAPPASIGPADQWRSTENDGVNAAYLYLHCYGGDTPYEEVTASIRKHATGARGVSLATLRDALCRLGVPSRIRRCSPTELRKLPMPAIIHLTDPRGGGGRFALLRGAPADPGGPYGTVEGATIEIGELSADDFRRCWSGHVLTYSTGHTELGFLAGANVSLAALYAWWRRRRGRWTPTTS